MQASTAWQSQLTCRAHGTQVLLIYSSFGHCTFLGRLQARVELAAHKTPCKQWLFVFTVPSVLMQALLEMVCMGSSDTELQATAAIALGNLARYAANRCCCCSGLAYPSVEGQLVPIACCCPLLVCPSACSCLAAGVGVSVATQACFSGWRQTSCHCALCRATLVRLGALEVLLDVVRQRDAVGTGATASPPAPTATPASTSLGSRRSGRGSSLLASSATVAHVRRLGAAALAALLEDDASKLQV